MRRFGRAGDAAFDLRVVDARGQHRERLGRIVARLHLERRPVDRLAVEPRRRAGLEAAEREAERAPASRDSPIAGASPTRPAGICCLADMDEAAQERAGGEHHGARSRDCAAVREADAGDAAAVDDRDRRPRPR